MTTHDKDKIIAAAKEAGICFRTQPPGTREVFCWQSDIERFYAIAFKAGVDTTVPKAFAAGSASRDAKIAELMDVFNKARKFVFEWDNCGSSGEWPVIELANLREALAKVKKP